jgi:hypothetical protein
VEEYIVVSERQRGNGRKERQYQRYFKVDDSEWPQSPLVAAGEPIRRRRSSELLLATERRTRSSARRRTRRAQTQTFSEHHEYDSQKSSDLEDVAEQTYREYLSDGAPLHTKDRPLRRSRYYVMARGHESRLSAQRLEDDLSEDSVAKFREASRSRRRERASFPPQDVCSAHPEIQEKLNNLKENEMLVVTERYVYRPPRSTSAIDTPMRDERADRGRKADGIPQRFISQVDSAEYFPEEWSRASGHAERHVKHRRVRPRDLDGASMQIGPGSSEASLGQQSYHEGM